MAIISDIAGTTLNSFSLNDKVTLFYSDDIPDDKLGNIGDFCFNKLGDIYAKKPFEKNDDDEIIITEKWMKITDSVLPAAQGSKELVFDDNDANLGNSYNTTENITYEKTDGHLHDNIIIENEIRDNNSTIIPNIGYLNKNFVHNKGVEHIAGEKTFDDIIKGTSPADNAEGKEIITAEWVRNNISGKKLGEIVWSPIPLDDTSLLLLNGQRINKKTYPDFYELIKKIKSSSYQGGAYSNLVKSTSSTSLLINRSSSNGNYGYFYINDSSDNDEEKYLWLPDYSTLMTLSVTVKGPDIGVDLGEYLKPGLPNITGRTYGEGGSNGDYGCYEGAFYQPDESDVYPRGVGSGNTDRDNRWTLFNAQRCSSIYGSSDTVQPESVKNYVYIVVASSVKGDTGSLNIQALINEIITYKNQVIELGNEIDNIKNNQSELDIINHIWKDKNTGLMIQVGSSYNNEVSFEEPFTTFCEVSGVCNYSGRPQDDHGNIYDKTNYGFKIAALDGDMTPYHWIAIGK